MTAARTERRHSALVGVAGLIFAFGLIGCGSFTPIQEPFNKGVYHQSSGNFDAAIAEYRAAVADDPEDYRSWFNLGTCYESRGRARRVEADDIAHGLATTGQANAELSDRLEELRVGAEADLVGARDAYEQVLALEPNNPRAHINIAAMMYDGGDHEGAKSRLREVSAEHDAIGLAKVALAAHLMREARGLEAGAERDGRLDESVELLEAAASAESKSLAALMMLGEAHHERGNLDGAREALDAAIARDPNDVATMIARARVELSAAEILRAAESAGEQPGVAATADTVTAEAASWLYRALYIDEFNFEAHYLLHEIERDAGNLEAATEHLWACRRQRDRRPEHIPAIDYDAKLRKLYMGLLGR